MNATEMPEGLSMYMNSPALYLYPWVLAWLVWLKSKRMRIPLEIPVVCLNDFSHPNEIPVGQLLLAEKDCPFAIDGERYYFTKQVRRDGSGKGSNRKAGEQGAYWKSTSKDINITDLDGKLMGYMRKYTLYNKVKDDKRSENWYMEEYRAHDPHELDDPYVLCKIYEKESACEGQTDGSIRALTKRAIERKQGSQPNQTKSKFGNMSPSTSTPKNPIQTQFDNNNVVEDPFMQQIVPTFENFPPNSIPIPRPHDASRNQNRPESIPPIPLNNNSMNHSQTQFDNNFDENLMMQQTLPTSENFLSDQSILPSIPGSCLYSSEFLPMTDPSFSGPSMVHYSLENQNAPDGEQSPLYLWNHRNF